MSEYKLMKEIIDLSVSKVWDAAKLEWSLAQIYEADEPERCLCGHFPIIEICILQNNHNHNQATLGNCCVKKFIGLPSDKIFQAVKRVRKDNEKSLNAEAIIHAYRNGWINEWEYNFSIDTIRKIKLSVKQLQTRVKVNEKMLFNMRRGNQNG
ncbi:hypothetical protein [Marinomonas sp. BSi20584]|uniref:hypothetical protein n=1 Tax=Marinomonas sp. BSi20584 TaxID=1594462 RepID=UPI000C1E4A25|nr:hypothetical protein [Marinomonas sp. BSi20584]PJE53621.1 hypothetical protein TY87_19500 [Marinomonas sp. BSi20584]